MKIYSLMLFVLFSGSALAAEDVSPKPNAEVQQRTQQVVPYSLEQTKQMFTKTVHGGVQHVEVKSADNTEQIKLIQSYLLKMSNNFRKGDFSDTERIHGANMPGLAELKKARPYEIKFEYKALPLGAQVHYSSEVTPLVRALHAWIDAQKKEHHDPEIKEHSKHHAAPAE
jgi:hypothetical protein